MKKLQLLIPLDGTEFSQQVLPIVRRLFKPEDYAIKLVHVAEPLERHHDPLSQPALIGADYTFLTLERTGAPEATKRHPIYGETDLESYRQTLEGHLRGQVERFEGQGYSVTTTVHFGQPADEIVALVEEDLVDVIAMATHGRSGLSRLFQGSVAQDVLKRVNVPVLLLRAEDETNPAEPAEESEDVGVTPVAAENATLHGLRGQGVITVVRTDNGSVKVADGSWQPLAGQSDLASLEQAFDEGRRVHFEGFVAEGGAVSTPSLTQAQLEVDLTSLNSYTDDKGRSFTQVNFRADPATVEHLLRSETFA